MYVCIKHFREEEIDTKQAVLKECPTQHIAKATPETTPGLDSDTQSTVSCDTSSHINR